MRIAMAVDPNIPVPPRYYGGIERIVDTLGRGLTAEGHEVTLFSHRASEGPFRLVAYPEMETTGSTLWRHILLIASTVLAGNYDLVHSFGRLAYLLPILPCAIPKLMSYQRGIMVSSVRWGRRLARGTLHFAACSRHLIDRFPGGSDWHLVYNGVPSDRYRFRPQIARDAPLIFLGRVEQIKGPCGPVAVSGSPATCLQERNIGLISPVTLNLIWTASAFATWGPWMMLARTSCWGKAALC